ncbi:AraC family transcriptional regulator [Paenibacillus sp. UNC499MF]|uniref:helix-turn-helix domain-containing protein n=1 Tax=Paenibacillus sp. UNC499MF TaxID=1502751 RepID=UPI0008A032D1|nr:helix-turn-helix transcriptional regulator [Paenibacillus sp. UNC499MF]SEF87132.1 AraC-type DNA-binding protein [Paenibacillus sp. UNC499MF]
MIVFWDHGAGMDSADIGRSDPRDTTAAAYVADGLILHVGTAEDARRQAVSGNCEALVVLTENERLNEDELPADAAVPVYVFTKADKQSRFVIQLLFHYMASIQSHVFPGKTAAGTGPDNDMDWERVLKHIRDNLGTGELSLESAAKECYVCKWQFSKVFKKQFGVTFRDYLIEQRIGEAKKLLVKGHSVTDACYAVGYGDMTHFGRIFRKKVGVSPSDYRKHYYSQFIL